MTTNGALRQVAYYKGCLASLSAKELDSSASTGARAEGGAGADRARILVTCCGAGDIQEAEPDYYLHLNARIISYAAATGADTLMTVCNVCTLNLPQANFQLMGDAELRARINTNLEAVGVPPYERDVDVRHFLWELAEGDGYEQLKTAAHKGLKGLRIAPFYGCQILRPSRILGFEDPDRPSSLERIYSRPCGGRGGRLPRQAQMLRFPDHPGTRGDGARRARPADRAGLRGGGGRDRHPLPALPPLARRLAVQTQGNDGHADFAMPIASTSRS